MAILCLKSKQIKQKSLSDLNELNMGFGTLWRKTTVGFIGNYSYLRLVLSINPRAIMFTLLSNLTGNVCLTDDKTVKVRF